jgi:hypothetical protein
VPEVPGYPVIGKIRNLRAASKRSARDDGATAADRRASSRRQLHAVGRFLDPEHCAAGSWKSRWPQSRQSSLGIYGVCTSGRRPLTFVRRLGDFYGRRHIFLTGLSLLTAASLLGGVSTGPALLLAARALQGVASAMTAPAALSLLISNFRRRKAACPGIGPRRLVALGRLHSRSACRRNACRRTELALGFPD